MYHTYLVEVVMKFDYFLCLHFLNHLINRAWLFMRELLMHRSKLGNNKELIKNIKWTQEVSKLFYEYASRLFSWCFASIPQKSYRRNYNLTCFPWVIKIGADWKNKYLYFIFFRWVRSAESLARLKTCETLMEKTMKFHDWNVFKTNKWTFS